MPVYRSRFELERVLGRHGATDFAVVEADSSASIQFAVHGRFVQLALPLPDAKDVRITETASGRPRPVVAQERAYEQALREDWRAFVLAVKGKLQSVESGISTFDDEFASFLVPHAREDGSRKRRKKPRAVNWLLGSSHTVAIALAAAFLVPTSAVSAFALPPSVVDHLSAPFSSVPPAEPGEGNDDAHAIALASSGWTHSETRRHGEGLAVAESGDLGALTEHHQARTGSHGAAAGSDVNEPSSADGPTETSPGGPENSETSGGAPVGGDTPGTGQGGGGAPGANSPPHGRGPSPGNDKPAGGGGPSKPVPGDGAGSSTGSQPPSDPGPVDPGKGNAEDGHDNGNHTGAGNGNAGADNGNHNGADNAGADNGNKNEADKGTQAGADNGNHNGADNGNHNGADNGNKAGDTGSGQPAAGKGQSQAGQ